MAATVRLFEDYGSLVSGRGEFTKITSDGIHIDQASGSGNNYGIGNSPISTTIRSPSVTTYSFKRYFYGKIEVEPGEGSYGVMYKAYWYIEGSYVGGDDATFYYKNTTTYAAPDKTYDPSLTAYVSGTPVMINCGVSNSSPHLASSFSEQSNGTTFYTSYLLTQWSYDPKTALAPVLTSPVSVSLIIAEAEEW